MYTQFVIIFTSSILFSLLSATDTVRVDSIFSPFSDVQDTAKIIISSPLGNLLDSELEEDIFDAQISEAKYIYAEAIISDLTGDTLESAYQFELLLSLIPI